MAYKVIKQFADLKDGGHVYKEGDKYPRTGYHPTEDRIKELASSANKRGLPLITAEPEEKQETPKAPAKKPAAKKPAAKKATKKTTAKK